MAPPPMVALEIGTTTVRAVIGEVREKDMIMVIGAGEDASVGMRKSEIVDLNAVTDKCRKVIAQTEEEGDVAIRQVYIAISGSHIRCDDRYGIAHVPRDDRVITEHEIEAVRAAAQSMHLPPNREILHSIGQYYTVDGRPGVLDPVGMVGSELRQDVLVIHGGESAIRTVIRAASLAQVDVEDTAFGGLCSALAVLAPEQKACGAAVIDLGGGTTDVVVYAQQVVAHAASIGVGGDHVTNDLTVGLHLTTRQAEFVKVQHGTAAPAGGAARGRVVAVPPDGTYGAKSIREDDVNTIIHARMDELFKIIHADLATQGLLCHLGSGVILTGGGAQMRGVPDLVEKIFNMPCVVGRPRGLSGLSKITGGTGYAACLGMLRYAAMTKGEEGPGSQIRKILKKFLRLGEDG